MPLADFSVDRAEDLFAALVAAKAAARALGARQVALAIVEARKFGKQAVALHSPIGVEVATRRTHAVALGVLAGADGQSTRRLAHAAAHLHAHVANEAATTTVG